MKVLITGINGFVASHFAKLLIDEGHEVIGTSRWTEDDFRIRDIKDKIIIVPMDLNDSWSCLSTIKKHKPDWISHLAAQSYVQDSFIYPAETIRTNTLGTLNLLEAIRLNKNINYNPIVHICSSSEVYGLVKEEDVPIKETQPFNPSNPYAVGKVGEDMLALMYWTNYQIKTIRTRMFTHTGWGRTMLSAECNFARQIALIEKGMQAPIVYHGNLNSIRTWADVRDAVKAYYLLFEKGEPGEAYNIGGNITKKIEEVLDYLLSLSSVEIGKNLDPKLLRPYDVTLQIPDCSKFKKLTRWHAVYSFEETMKEVLSFWRHYV
jgi:GDP-mannose 4,6-dehydratase